MLNKDRTVPSCDSLVPSRVPEMTSKSRPLDIENSSLLTSFCIMPDPTTSLPPVPLDICLQTIGSTTRWNILRELADGGSLMVSELATRTGYDPSAVSKQLTFLRRTGIVINPRGRLFEIAPQFIADKTQRLLDFGWVTCRMDRR